MWPQEPSRARPLPVYFSCWWVRCSWRSRWGTSPAYRWKRAGNDWKRVLEQYGDHLDGEFAEMTSAHCRASATRRRALTRASSCCPCSSSSTRSTARPSLVRRRLQWVGSGPPPADLRGRARRRPTPWCNRWWWFLLGSTRVGSVFHSPRCAPHALELHQSAVGAA